MRISHSNAISSFKILVLLFIFIIVSLNAKQIYMAEVYRHGARYPVYDYYDYNQTKYFSGLLTSVGLREHFLLGSYLQHQYIKSKTPLLNATLNPRETEFFSSPTPTLRCEESAYAQTLGMFPFGDGEEVPQNIDSQLLQPPFETILPASLKSESAPQNFALDMGFQPVPIRVSSAFFPDCPNLNVLLSKRGQEISKDLTVFQTEQSVFTDKMRLVFNLTAVQSNVGNLQELADTIISDKYLGRDLPTAFTDSDYRQIYYIRNYMLTSLYSAEVAQILSAPYVNILLHNMELKVKNSLEVKKFSSVSAHENNIIALLTFYNITSGDCLRKQFKNQTYAGNCADPIPFSSNLMFELHQNDTDATQFFVKVRYNGVYYKLFSKNTTETEWTEFQAKSKASLKDFNTECKVKTTEKIKKKPDLLIQ